MYLTLAAGKLREMQGFPQTVRALKLKNPAHGPQSLPIASTVVDSSVDK